MPYFILILLMDVIYGDLQQFYRKKCVRIMTFSDFNSHTNPLFINLKLLKVQVQVQVQVHLFYSFKRYIQLLQINNNTKMTK